MRKFQRWKQETRIKTMAINWNRQHTTQKLLVLYTYFGVPVASPIASKKDRFSLCLSIKCSVQSVMCILFVINKNLFKLTWNTKAKLASKNEQKKENRNEWDRWMFGLSCNYRLINFVENLKIMTHQTKGVEKVLAK